VAEHAEEAAALPVDGVGLLRAEFMVADALGGAHPRLLIQRGQRQEFVDKMTESLSRIATACGVHDEPRAAPGTGRKVLIYAGRPE
jgi:pyruvate,water dikinase